MCNVFICELSRTPQVKSCLHLCVNVYQKASDPPEKDFKSAERGSRIHDTSEAHRGGPLKRVVHQE